MTVVTGIFKSAIATLYANARVWVIEHCRDPAVVIPYGFNKFFIMKEYGDTNFMTIVDEDAIGIREEFGFNQTRINMMFYFTTFQ